jgi:glucose-1-phosphate cytidylyltransferase
MLTYGDGLIKMNLRHLFDFHLKHKKIATLTSVKPPARFGEVFLEGSKVIKFEEKVQLNRNWINGGFFVFNYKIFNYIKNDQIMLEREPLTKLVKLINLKKLLKLYNYNLKSTFI